MNSPKLEHAAVSERHDVFAGEVHREFGSRHSSSLPTHPHTTGQDELPPISSAWNLHYVLANARTSAPLVIADQIALFVAFFTAQRLSVFGFGVNSAQGRLIGVLSAVLLLTFLAAKLYPAIGMTPANEFRRCALAITLFFAFVLHGATVIGADNSTTFVILVSWLISLSLIPTARFAMRRICAPFSWWKQKVLAVDGISDTDPSWLDRQIKTPAYAGLLPVVVRVDGPQDGGVGEPMSVAAPMSRVFQIARQQRIHRAMVSLENVSRSDPRIVSDLIAWFPHVSVVSSPHQTLRVDQAASGELMTSEISNGLRSPVALLVKRGFDVLLSVALLVALSPLIMLTAILVRVTSKGPVLYAQERIGRGGKRFHIWKFRTMYEGAEDNLEKYLDACPELKAEWEREAKLTRDPRVVPIVGSFLRRSSLDEIPQLWNVLKGEMSLVGPRPLPEYHLQKFDAAFRRHRQSVLPGVTGMWQVFSRGNGEHDAYVENDTRYIRNWSLSLDAVILVRTLTAVVSGRGAN